MSSQLLQIVAKAPMLGEVKTRLAVDVGEQKACDVYLSLLTKTVNEACSTEWQAELWCAPDTTHTYLQSLGKEYAMKLEAQPQGDIGKRMLFALQKGLRKAEKVVLIGTDCPVISSTYISAAFNALDTSDLVFGPAEDGGYVLVACNKVDEHMFDDVEWSCAETLKQNIEAVSRCGLTHQLLPELWDIDTYKDLQRWEEMKVTL
jgi:rSAM/selenodomain-associated transferase 1